MLKPARRRVSAWPAWGLSALAAAAAAQDCPGLENLSPDHTEIVASAIVPAGGFEQPGGGRFGARAYAALPAFCRVEAIARPAAGSQIGIEVWLPLSGWNKKLEGVGNGAWAGSISYSAMAEALAAGYAVAGTDTGHQGGRPDFALEHPDKLIDFAYRAVHEMTLTAKAVTRAFYERPEQRAYFSGCSTGGRQALTEAQRYPDDYDGIVAGAPAYYPSHIQGMQVWTAAVANRSAAGKLDAEAFGLLNKAVIAACDTLDGVADAVVEDPRQCAFDPDVLACSAGGENACLSTEQIETARRIYEGPTGRGGEPIYPGLARSSEAGWATLAGDAPLSLALETYALLVYDDPDWNWRDFDPVTDIDTAVERIGAVMDSDDADVADFVERGGKLLLYHGWSDPGIPPAGTIRYYENVQGALGPERADDAVRLFMVPGMGHCAGGTGTDRFDAVSALDGWLETGVPPERIEAERRANDELVRSRPLCPYPSAAAYAGSGGTDEASSFECR
jgi:feruloyl esterase